MRNYCTAYFTRVRGWDDPYPDNLQEYWAIGLSQVAAHNLAVASLLPIVAGFPNTDVFDEGIRYLLLNRETIVGVFTSDPTAGTVAFKAFSALADAEGLSVGQSPKYQPAKWPTSDGKRAKTKLPQGGTIFVSQVELLGMLYADLLAAGRPDLAAMLLPFIAAIAAGKPVSSVTVKNAFGQKLTFQQVLDLISAALA